MLTDNHVTYFPPIFNIANELNRIRHFKKFLKFKSCTKFTMCRKQFFSQVSQFLLTDIQQHRLREPK